MSALLATNPAVAALGAALLAFVWQGAIVGAVVAALLAATRRGSANLRYLIACTGLTLMALMPVATCAREWRPTSEAVSAETVTLRESATVAVLSSEPSPDRSWATRMAVNRVAPVIVLGWISGVLVLTLRLFGGWVQVARIRRGVRSPEMVEWEDAVARLAERLEIHRAVPLFESALVGVPVAIGWLSPVILIPAGLFAGLTPDHVDAILAHELAHIRRADYVVNAVQRVVEIVLFYHPAVWWVSGCIRREREHCCDDLAAPLSATRLDYAHALIALEERRGRAPALAMAATGSSLFACIRRIVDPASAIDSPLPKGAVMMIVSSVVALVLTGAVSVGHASPTPTSDRRPVALAPIVLERTTAVAAAPALGPVAVKPAVPPRSTPAAQATGSIVGTVNDQNNGRVPGAAITVDTIGRAGATRSVQSNARGEFAVGDLPEGAYLITVRLSGFAAEAHRVDVVSGQELTTNIQMKLGSIRESMEIEAGATGPVRQQPAPTAAVAGLLDQAKQATDSGRLAEAEASLRSALAVLHAAQVPPSSQVSGAVHVGGDIKMPQKIRTVDPVYPDGARAAGIQGTVIIEATVDRDGSVADARVLRGVPELNAAALEAVRQWVYSPTLLDGAPVPVLMTLTVVFGIK